MALCDIGYRPGEPARVQRFRALPVIASAIVLFSAALGERALAQDITTKEALEEDPTRDISRDEWRERVAEAKRRAQQLALENRERLMFSHPSVADEEQIASERVLNDDSLQPGDIVSTNKGLYVFKGRSDRERRDSNFMVLQPR
jgi:hypothetical protein